MTSFRFGDFAVSTASKSMRFVISADDSEEEGTRGDMLRKVPPEAVRELDIVVGTFLNE
jgi:hypothetical protein